MQCETERETERSDKRPTNRSKNYRRMRDRQPARLIGVEGMFVQISYVEPSLTWVKVTGA